MWCSNSSWFPGMGGFGGFGLSWIVLLLVVVGVVWLVRRSGSGSDEHRRSARSDRDDALRILRQRLASGDISEEDYERLRRAVES
jgi:putative membrane protein